MFIGEYSHNLDEKNRLSIPVKFRANLSEGCVLTRGLDHCLWIYPKADWQKFAEKISSLPITQRDARSFSRLMLAGAVDILPDKGGRIILPKYLMDYAEITTRVSVNGLYDRLEIWSEKNWQTFKTEMEKNSDDIAERLHELDSE